MGVLQATNGSANMTSVLVSLASPRYDATRRTLTFQVRPSRLADAPSSGSTRAISSVLVVCRSPDLKAPLLTLCGKGFLL